MFNLDKSSKRARMLVSKRDKYDIVLGSVARKMNSAIQRIMIFSNFLNMFSNKKQGETQTKVQYF